MSAGLNHGFARGYFLSFGLIVGIWTQVLVVGVGLGALIATSAWRFDHQVGRRGLPGVAGHQAVACPGDAAGGEHDRNRRSTPAAVSRRTLFLRGWGVNAVNPKGTVFLLAVVPQFLDLGHALWPQYGVIALTLAFTDLVVMAGYTALASKLLRLLKTPTQMRVLNRAFGSLFFAVGVLLATFRRS